MSHDQEILQEFVVECREGLDRIDSVLVALEAAPEDRSRLDTVFRVLHTIKGNAGFLDLPKLGAVAHAGESLLSRLVSGSIPVNSHVTDLLLRLVDAIRNVVAEVNSSGTEGDLQHDELIRELNESTSTAVKESPAESSKPSTSPPKAPRTNFREPKLDDLAEVSDAGGDAKTQALDLSEIFPQPGRVEPKSVPPEPPAFFEPPLSAENTASLSDSGSGSSLNSGSLLNSGASLSSRVFSEPEQSTVIRVQIDHLDDLMNLVGELVLTRNRIVQITASRHDDELTEPIQRLNRLTAALQDGVMRTRMQPVRNAWKKYPRIVRDLAKQCGKQCEIELQGGDTELDKSMLEAIADPLVHLVRNSIDHGIEKPYLRRIKGKPETGRLLVRAFQESGQVHIEISDDGAGLDLERIRKKAIEVGIISSEKALLATESELRNSIFLPGFTTAEKVTSLSGRGVGMDVVKTSVEQIGGTIELHTQKDVGTTIRLTVPLTLAIVPAVMVACGSQRFAIPQINVVEMLRLEGEERHLACDLFYDTPVLKLRGDLLPMADLCQKLHIHSNFNIATREKLEILVLKSGTRRFALLVDAIGDAQEIVVKPLGELLASQTQYSGAALMGDGSIALILDVLGIARSAGLLEAEKGLIHDSEATPVADNSLDHQVLICQIDGERQIAIPLADVVCLEQIPSAKIEKSATGDVLQYRGEILPLRNLSQNQRVTSATATDDQQLSVVIYRAAETQMGLLVDRIIDVAQRPTNLRSADANVQPGGPVTVIGTAVVLGRVTDFLQLN